MRLIGSFNTEKHALRFWSYIKKQGIESSLEKADSPKEANWEVWIAEEDQVDSAFSFLSEFQADPEDQKYEVSSQIEKDAKTRNPSRNRGFREFNLRDKWQRTDRSAGTMTLSLIITCVAVFLLSGMGKNTELVGGFLFQKKLMVNYPNFLMERSGAYLLQSFFILTFCISCLTCFGSTTLVDKSKKEKDLSFSFLSYS